MNKDTEITLQLKYHQNPRHWKEQILENTKQQDEIREINKTLLLAERLLSQFKQNQRTQQTQSYTRKISLNTTPKYQCKNKRFQMYETQQDNKLHKTISEKPFGNSSFYSYKSKERTIPSKPSTAQGQRRIKEYQIKKPSIQRIMSIPFENISARSWAVFDAKNGGFLGGFNQHKQRQIASITKIMTCWVSLQLTEQYKLDIDDIKFQVPAQAVRVGGTTANLERGDKISIRDLLYGLMLPSGNDAATTLAYNFQMYNIQDDDEYFIKEMNRWASQFELDSTRFANVHGLSNEFSCSTAHDVGKMAYRAMQHPQLSNIVKTKIYFAEVEDLNGEQKELFWENTNKMLHQGFKGIKTGITTKAGPCVVEYYEDSTHSFIIVLLCCSSTEQRWQDATKILEWAKNMINKNKCQ